MKIFFFTASSIAAPGDKVRISNTLRRVAASTDTFDLVVSFYLMERPAWNGGTAYVQSWLGPQAFRTGRGKWKISRQFPHPDSLPEKFKLIRLKLTPNGTNYPLTEIDRYGWRHWYGSFEDQLAFLFAHELHHYRRYHLGKHKREGEHSANRWALDHVQSLGFSVQSKKLAVRRKSRPRKTIEFYKVVNPNDFGANNAAGRWNRRIMLKDALLNMSAQKRRAYVDQKLECFEQFRSLPPGSSLFIDYDPQQKYHNQQVTVVRVLRRNSTRIVIRTKDGKEWRWPMAWLKRSRPD